MVICQKDQCIFTMVLRSINNNKLTFWAQLVIVVARKSLCFPMREKILPIKFVDENSVKTP